MPESPSRIDRRVALKWLFTAVSAAAATQLPGAKISAPASSGIGTDPALQEGPKVGELWALTLTETQRAAAAAWCDLILPADERSPAASKVGVVDFIDEWISAPYPRQAEDRGVVLSFLAWGDSEAMARFARPFAELDLAAQAAIADDICSQSRAAPEYQEGARGFARFRDLTAGGFYTTPVGRDDIGYVGNMPLATFDGPPPEVLKQAGLLG